MISANEAPNPNEASNRRLLMLELALLMALFFIVGGDAPPMVNEAHYLAKAKHFWQPEWCSRDLFLTSGEAHFTFQALFGWPTWFLSLETTAWIGRAVGWFLLALGLQRLSWRLIPRPFAVVGVAAVWIAGTEYANLAGEWVVGGIEAKVPAYGLVLLGLAELVSRRWNRVWVCFGAASAFHVLVGGWSVIAGMVAWWATEHRRDDRKPLFQPGLFIGGALALFGLVPAIWLTVGATPDQSTAAAQVYTYFRLPHHLLPSTFPWTWYLRHGLLVIATAGAFLWAARGNSHARWRQLGCFTATAVGLALIGLLIGMLTTFQPDLAARLLRYYWFRLTDVAVPLLLALSLMQVLFSRTSLAALRVGSFACLLLSVAAIGWSSYERMRIGVPPSASHRVLGWDVEAPPRTQQRTFRDWLALCRWVQVTTPEQEQFLTPRHQQTFKWYAERAEVVNWKDVPQDAASLQEWLRRFTRVFPRRLGTIRVSIQYATLDEFREEYGVRYMIVDRRVTGPHLPLVQVYPREPERNDTYAVYELPR